MDFVQTRHFKSTIKVAFFFYYNAYSALFKVLILLENIFFSCNILYLNVIEDDNLIGTLSEIEKHCETSQGIVSEATYVLTNVPKVYLKYFVTSFFLFQQCMLSQKSRITLRFNFLYFVLIMSSFCTRSIDISSPLLKTYSVFVLPSICLLFFPPQH